MGTWDDDIDDMPIYILRRNIMQGDYPINPAVHHHAIRVQRRTSTLCTNDASSLEDLHKVRRDGNRLFAEKNWAAAVKKYTECINQTQYLLSDNNQDNYSRFLMLVYSNRAETRLRLLQYEDAFSDVEKALEIEPTHLKTLVRKGKAAHGLGLFEKARQAFTAALAKSPGEQSIAKDLMASITALNQSRTGQYDLCHFFLRCCTGEAPSCADFVGPVEIRRVGYGRGRRGLFATRNLKPGELILLSNPLAIVRSNLPVPLLNDSCSKTSRTMDLGRNLISELLKRIRTSKRQMAQLYSLCGSGMDEMEIPSMDLFRAGGEWLPEGWEKFQVNAEHIGQIVSLNAVSESEHIALLYGHLGPAPQRLLVLWALPSFANHSCNPNMFCFFIGDAVTFRASENVVKGEELTISYLSERVLINHGVKARRAETKEWGFTCKCARCLLEESLQPKLSKMVNTALSYDSLDAGGDAEGDGQVYPNFSRNEGLQALAVELANEMEGLIQSQGSRLGPKEHGWIRAPF